MNIEELIITYETKINKLNKDSKKLKGISKSVAFVELIAARKTLSELNTLRLGSVSYILPPLNTVRQEIDKYSETMQNNKGHFQNGINWGLNYIAKKIKK